MTFPIRDTRLFCVAPKNGCFCCCICLKCLRGRFVSARIRKMWEGNVFTRICLLAGRGGGAPCFPGLWSQVLSGGEYPTVLSRIGVALAGVGVAPPLAGIGVLPNPPEQKSEFLARASGTLLAVTQEDFLVKKTFNIYNVHLVNVCTENSCNVFLLKNLENVTKCMS